MGRSKLRHYKEKQERPAQEEAKRKVKRTGLKDRPQQQQDAGLPDTSRRDPTNRGKARRYKKTNYGVRAMTRRGLPEPFTIFSGAAMTTAPVGGS